MEDKLEKRYLAKFDELNNIAKDIINKPNKTGNEFTDILIDAYVEGFACAEYILGGENKLNETKMEEALNKTYDGVSIQAKYEEYLSSEDETSLNRLIENEYHRMYVEGQQDYASESGVDEEWEKVWHTVGDDRVRDTHAYLEGMSTDINGYFFTFDGDYARFPSDFQNIENNVNCRCVIDFRKKK